MCGRFTNWLTWREIVALYRLAVPATPEHNLPARHNICPTDTIDVVIERGGQADLVRAHPFMVDEDRQGSPGHLQRAGRDIGSQAYVS
jgi:putative SOS response-associated peptidase YedK